MKYYLLPAILLLALYGCQNASNNTETHNSSKVSAGKTADDPDKTLQGVVNRAGLYRLVRSGGVINDAKTGTGKSVSKPVVEFLRKTDRIPLIKGGQIYFQYRIWPVPSQPAHAELRRVVKHPEMKLPDGTVSTGSDYTIKGKVSSGQVIAYTGYGLDEDYELVEGDWVFEIWYQDKKIIEQTFTTYRPDEVEIAELEPIIVLGNKAIGQQNDPSKDPFSKFNWPKVNIGGTKAPESKQL